MSSLASLGGADERRNTFGLCAISSSVFVFGKGFPLPGPKSVLLLLLGDDDDDMMTSSSLPPP